MQTTDLARRSSLSRLLVVEDDAAQLRTLSDMIADEGFTVCACRTAAEALRAARGQDHSVAIIDLHLPDLEGTELLEQLRTINPHVRVIIYTGYASFGSAKDALNCGAFAYVEKLGDPAELIRHIQRASTEQVRQYASELEQAVVQRTAALQESESRLRAVVDGAIDALLVVTPDGVIDTFNPAAVQMFGYEAVDVLGQDVLRLFPPAQHEDHRRSLAQALAQAGTTSQGKRVETIGRRQDGSTFPVELGVSVMQVGERCLLVELLRDLTERKRAEEDRLRLERQMRQAQKMEALGTLAGGVAHDFNNILVGIRGFTELVLTALPAESMDAGSLQQVLQLTDRASGLVKQILAFSRKREQERQPIDLRRVVQEALTLVRAMVPATVEIRKQQPDEPVIVQADPTQLHQVVMNLCSNAAHAMRTRGGTLTLAIEAVRTSEADLLTVPLSPGGYYRLSVSDTGHGMTPEVRERIFDPFFTTKGAGEGTGMGLSVVLGIVEGLEGRIHVESEPELGTRFAIYLPRADVSPAKGSKPAAPPVGGKGRILLVDDEVFILNWVSILLRRLGYEVETFSNSVEGLNRFRANPLHFDLVVTDQTMPRMTGAELTRELLQLRTDLPVVMISGFSEQIDAERARELGARDFLMKPFSSVQLADAIRLALKGETASTS